MVMITNIQHFMDENGEIPELTLEADILLQQFAAFIEAATVKYERPVTLSSTGCHKIYDGEFCDGDVEVWVYAETNQIGWECQECSEEGIITHWEGTPWDLRNYTLH